MKKIIAFIITFLSFFSIQNHSNAYDTKTDGLINSLLNLDNWPLLTELNLSILKSYTLKDTLTRKTYITFKEYDTLIKSQIMKAYTEWIYTTTTMNSLVKNYNNFVYYTNKIFYYLNILDKNPTAKNNTEVQSGLLNAYKNSKIYYNHVKNNLQIQK